MLLDLDRKLLYNKKAIGGVRNEICRVDNSCDRFMPMLVPLRSKLDDGGSVKYNAVLYDVTDWHAMTPVEGEYNDGVTVEVLVFTVYDSTKIVKETPHTKTQETLA